MCGHSSRTEDSEGNKIDQGQPPRAYNIHETQLKCHLLQKVSSDVQFRCLPGPG